MTILVTGGMDYIGSHICVKLLNRDYRVVILDNLSNSKIETIARIKLLNKSNKITFYKTDILNYNNLDEMFELEKIDVVVHFADLKAVSESIINPSLYYENNIQGIINLLKVMDKYKIKCLVFSSSATVYSSNSNVPFKEDHFLSPINPYGRTKLFIQEIMKDYYTSKNDISIVILRYFNPMGAHETSIIGEEPRNNPNNLMLYIYQLTAEKINKLNIFGSDYPTPDGSCIRDYIHITDLVQGHISSLEAHNNDPGVQVYNLGKVKA